MAFSSKTLSLIGCILQICVLSFFLHVNPADCLPQYATLNGEQCISCHINAQGGGLRNYRGWRYHSDVGLIIPETVKLGALYAKDRKSNTALNSKLTYGGDFRVQMVRSHKSPDANRRIFPMQAALYTDYEITDRVHAELSYNFGPKKFDGQQAWTSSIIIQPEFSYTQFRMGFFQPSIGLRYDDHIMLVRRTPGADGNTIIAPNYAEYGAEFTYNGFDTFSFTAGVFDAKSLAENFVINNSGHQVSLIDDKHNPSWLGRIVFWPENYIEQISIFSGVSYYVNNDFSISNLFAGIGILEKISLLTDYSRTVKTNMRSTNNLMVETGFEVSPPLRLFIRGERGKTFTNIGGSDLKTYTNQGVIGAQILLLPYVEFRPEYRIVDTERFRSTRYFAQIHIFR
ncbi:hypothetical protein ACFL50_02605 [Candidatus Latescibacterota bacterium]